MTCVVISQPMLFPWAGLFEQIRLADVYVHYDDVQFSKGGFINRVQIKLPGGVKWMTVPLEKHRLGQAINEVAPSGRTDWRRQHLEMLAQSFRGAPFGEDALAIVRRVYGRDYPHLAGLLIAGIEEVCAYLGLDEGRRFLLSSRMGIGGRGSARVADIVAAAGGDTYVTGHGAKNYLDYELFEKRNIRVEYIDYQKKPYPQRHGGFTPYVSILDLIANTGREGIGNLVSGGVYWKEFAYG